MQAIKEHIEQQKQFLLDNINTNNSLASYFKDMYFNDNTQEGYLYDKALSKIEQYDNNNNDKIKTIINYIVCEFKNIHDNTNNGYIKEYIKTYLRIALYSELHHYEAVMFCRESISFLVDK